MEKKFSLEKRYCLVFLIVAIIFLFAIFSNVVSAKSNESLNSGQWYLCGKSHWYSKVKCQEMDAGYYQFSYLGHRTWQFSKDWGSYQEFKAIDLEIVQKSLSGKLTIYGNKYISDYGWYIDNNNSCKNDLYRHTLWCEVSAGGTVTIFAGSNAQVTVTN